MNIAEANNTTVKKGRTIQVDNFDTGEIKELTWTPTRRAMVGKLRKICTDLELKNEEYSIRIIYTRLLGDEEVFEGLYAQTLRELVLIYDY